MKRAGWLELDKVIGDDEQRRFFYASMYRMKFPATYQVPVHRASMWVQLRVQPTAAARGLRWIHVIVGIHISWTGGWTYALLAASHRSPCQGRWTPKLLVEVGGVFCHTSTKNIPDPRLLTGKLQKTIATRTSCIDATKRQNFFQVIWRLLEFT